MSEKMSTQTIPLNQAQRVVTDITYHLKDVCARIEVAGSVRRERPLVHDVDIVVIPQLFMWNGTIPSILIKKLGAKIIKDGPLIKQFTIRDIPIDLIHATYENWGIRMLRWTGSAAHNIKLAKHARSKGMKLAVSEGLLGKQKNLIEAKDEQKIFQALDLDYVLPKDREVNK